MNQSLFIRSLRTGVLALAICGGVAASYGETYRYGYAPAEPRTDDLFAQGTGLNNQVSGAVCLDPAKDPVFRRLLGGKILGVRFYLLNDYKQQSKGHSYGFLYEGSLDSEPVQKVQNLLKGWNEVMFDTPVEIKDTPYYVGFNVFELKSVAMPLISYKHASLPGGCYTNLSKEGWEQFSDRGTLFIEAIIEAPDGLMDHQAISYPGTMPVIVAPGKEFEAPVYVKNMSATPLADIVMESATDEFAYQWEHSFSTPLPALDGCMLPSTLRAPLTPSEAASLTVRITKANGEECPAVYSAATSLYVSEDVFTRIPLVEEFTSFSCVNCPFMMYYMERAIKEYNAPLVYLTRHAGFVKDKLTTPSDEAILYLFGDDGTFNPAAMFDRRVLQGEVNPIMKARDASTVPYLERIQTAMKYPALAKIDVDYEVDADRVASVTAHGKINAQLAATGKEYHIATYIVEDGIPADVYPQQGIINPVDDAPEDLVSSFRHNGSIRAVLQSAPIGDILQYDSEGNFSVTYPAVTLADNINKANTHAVSMIYRVNTENLRDNEVLNCGSSRYNTNASAEGISADTEFEYQIIDGCVRAVTAGAKIALYSISGQRVDAAQKQAPGIYLLRYTLSDGSTGVRKLHLR